MDKKAYQQEYYQRNKETTAERVKQRRHEIKRKVRAYKAELGCQHCDEDHPACLQFHHHVNPRNSDEGLKVTQLVNNKGWSWERLKAYIDSECRVLCANCHCKEHDTVL